MSSLRRSQKVTATESISVFSKEIKHTGRTGEKPDSLRTFVDQAATKLSYTPLMRKVLGFPHFGAKPVLEHEWSFGYDINKCFLNMTNEYCCLIAFTTANMLLLFNYEYKTMSQLCGHIDDIEQLVGDDSGRWLATFDKGENNRVVIWDIGKGVPVKTIHIYNEKAENLTMSPGGKYLLITFDKQPKTLHFYIWSSYRQKPSATIHFDQNVKEILNITFSKRKDEYFVVTTPTNIIFLIYNQEGHEIEFHNPIITRGWPKYAVEYTCSVYHGLINVCYSATVKGGLAVWGDETIMKRLPLKEEYNIIETQKNAPLTNQLNGRFYIELHQSKITGLRWMDRYLICLDEQSIITFHDMNSLSPIYCFDEAAGSDIKDFQFHLCAREEKDEPTGLTAERSSIKYSSFLKQFRHQGDKEDIRKWQSIGDIIKKQDGDQSLIRDLILQTKNNLIYLNPITGKTHFIFEDSIHDATVVDAHPMWDYICIGTSSCDVYLFDYVRKENVAKQTLQPNNLEKASITCIKFSPNGLTLACGMSDGTFCCLHPLILKAIPKKTINKSKAPIRIIEFCDQSSHMAYADDDMVIVLFTIYKKFRIIGSFKAHHEPITGLRFSVWETVKKLYSISEDRSLNEYDVKQCMLSRTLTNSNRITLSLESIPLALVTSPVCSKLLIISMSNFQFRIIDTDTMKLEDIRKAPTLTFPLHNIMDLECGNFSGNKYFLFASGCKLGVLKGPIDGNPFKWMTLRTGTSAISSLCASRTGLKGFSISQNHPYVHMWKINHSNLDLLERIGGKGLAPFYALFKNGRKNPITENLQEIFCLAMLQHRGIYNFEGMELTSEREIPLCELPSVIRGLGVFPSNDDMENIINMQAFKSDLISDQKVSFHNVATLFCNLQQENDFSYEKMQEAFQTICNYKSNINRENKPLIKREDFIKCLEEEGEKFTPLESYNLFRTLTGHKEGDHYFYESFGDLNVFNFLPPKINLPYFIGKLMGFPGVKYEYEEIIEDEDINIYSDEPSLIKAMAKF